MCQLLIIRVELLPFYCTCRLISCRCSQVGRDGTLNINNSTIVYTIHVHVHVRITYERYFQLTRPPSPSPSPLQCVPAGSLPLMSAHTDHDCSFLAPSEFEDVSQMVEWLILIESKLQPERMVVGDFLQMRRMLRDLQVSSYTPGCKNN